MTPLPVLKVLSVSPLDARRLEVALSNGKSGVFDVSPYFRGDFFSELKNAEYFSQVAPDSAKTGIYWPNGQDLSAYTIEAGLRPLSDTAQKSSAEKRTF